MGKKKQIRNVDKIREQEKQLRVLQNKLEYMEEQNKRLRAENELLDKGSCQINQIVAAMLIDVVQRYGKKKMEKGRLFRYRLAVSYGYDIDKILSEWELHVVESPMAKLIDERFIDVVPKKQPPEQ